MQDTIAHLACGPAAGLRAADGRGPGGRWRFDYTPGGSELLNYLIRQAAVPEYQVRWRWTRNSFAIWDNRSTQHYAVQDYWPAVRKMERAGVIGDKTF
ncbi:TauD/TfdA family dioxygenase [Actinoplanes regularis]|uniref:Taurine catabolism dioxygenase TauD, TfdA family n=1 Tax=Actinoplanes regularis TaxID=52697 RepID=A0A238YWH3_9ACTN|nr:TauD/TfdA family dioxygenase [Actinoplanes regularis]GIE85629.1 hypothetical protein Are01nite_21090 [Actinoplanes regularis]SNR75646.1 Taurine catabolism dioxygenase TauD, TfdA family [Actinoplanes regularis]